MITTKEQAKENLNNSLMRHYRAITALQRAQGMVKELKGQEHFYSISPEEKLQRIRDKSDAVAKKTREMLQARAAYAKLQAEEKEAKLDLNAEVGTPGRQEILAELKEEIKLDDTVLTLVTNNAMSDKRRKDVEYKAIRALSAVGIITNMDLAAMINHDSHGLAGVLSKCEHVERVHDGNLNNERMSWRLKPGVDVEKINVK